MTTRRGVDKRPDKRDRYDRRRPDLGALDRLMRERVSLSPMPPVTPLHKMGGTDDNDHDTDDNRSNEKDR